MTAVFEKKSYELSVETEGEGAVSEEIVEQKSKDYEHGTVVELTTEPAEGWQFKEWQGDIEGTDNPEQITVEEAKEVTAVFEKKTFELSTNTEGEGTVSADPNQDEYEYDSTVELTAEADEGYKFVEWKGDVESTDSPEEITIDSNKKVTAVFEKVYELSVNTTGEGAVSIEPDQDEYIEGTEVEIQAEPADHWDFIDWSGDLSSDQDTKTITVDSDKDITANFEEIGYPVDLSIDGSGSVNKQVTSGEEKGNGYTYGSTVEITVEPDDGWNFVYWDEDLDGTDNPIELTIEDSVSTTANLDESPFEGGNGSEEYPYEVSNIDQLQAINDFMDSHFIQLNDIDASETENWNNGEGFEPIGDEYIAFKGVFDGQIYHIENLNIIRENDFIGLFGQVAQGLIKNVTLIDSNISGQNRTGILIGENDGEVKNSSVKGVVNGSYYTGGLIGENSGTVENARADVKVNGAWVVGILTGDNSTGDIIRSHSQGEVRANGRIGGIAGWNTGTINESKSTGADVISTQDFGHAGGLIGENRYGGRVYKSHSTNNIEAQAVVGGLVGLNNSNSLVQNSYAKGHITADNEAGGLVGINTDDAKINKSYSTGKVTGDEDIGGFIGINGALTETSYWDNESSNQSNAVGRGNSDGTTELTTSEMTGSSAEDNMPDFDWTEIWVTTDDYPVLFWE